MYGKYDGTELVYNGRDCQLIRDDDILVKYKDGDARLETVECVKDQVLVKLPEKQEQLDSGLLISDSKEQPKRPDQGIVAKIGPGRQAGNGKLMATQVSVGDQVKFRNFAGTEIKLNNEEYIVIRGYDILATM